MKWSDAPARGDAGRTLAVAVAAKSAVLAPWPRAGQGAGPGDMRTVRDAEKKAFADDDLKERLFFFRDVLAFIDKGAAGPSQRNTG